MISLPFKQTKQREVKVKKGSNRVKLRALFNKRQKFIIAMLILSLAFFFSERVFMNAGILFSFIIAICTELFFLWSMYSDIQDTKSYQIFVLPFFYSLSFGLFYYLTPPRFLTNIIVTTLYAIGLYSLFLSENIFVVASIRTIALLTGARIVSFVLTLVSFFFLVNVSYSLHSNIFLTVGIIIVFTFFLLYHSLWTYTLDKSILSSGTWVSLLTLCISEMAILLWFWPSSPTVIALFLTGLFYIVAGLSHVWIDRRLFRNVLWEYVWVGLVIFIIFIFSTQWRS